jgi:hypothetical protein
VGQERRYSEEGPPKYLRYTIEWKVRVNNREVLKNTEQDFVLAPASYSQCNTVTNVITGLKDRADQIGLIGRLENKTGLGPIPVSKVLSWKHRHECVEDHCPNLRLDHENGEPKRC